MPNKNYQFNIQADTDICLDIDGTTYNVACTSMTSPYSIIADSKGVKDLCASLPAGTHLGHFRNSASVNYSLPGSEFIGGRPNDR